MSNEISFDGKEDLAKWLEEGLRQLIEGNPVSVAVLAMNDKDEVLVGYFNASYHDKVIFARQINDDATLEYLINNIEDIKDALNDEGEDSQNEERGEDL